MPAKKKKPTPKAKAKPKLSRLQKPDELTLEEWQIALRRQFGREQAFRWKNVGEEVTFSDFLVTNPESKNTYRVTIRGAKAGDNACTCADFATNELGTCKHIEFVLGKLERKREAKRDLKEGYQPVAAEIRLRYGSQRVVSILPVADAPAKMKQLVAMFFDAQLRLKPEMADKFEAFLETAKKYDPELHCEDDVLTYLAELNDADQRAKLTAEMFPQGTARQAVAGFRDRPGGGASAFTMIQG